MVVVMVVVVVVLAAAVVVVVVAVVVETLAGREGVISTPWSPSDVRAEALLRFSKHKWAHMKRGACT